MLLSEADALFLCSFDEGAKMIEHLHTAREHLKSLSESNLGKV